MQSVMAKKNVSEILRKKGISVTTQRIEILKYLMQTKTHPTVEDIYLQIHSTFASLSRATVYNTVMAFKEVGLVQEITIEKEKARYDGNFEAHPHFFCRTCQKVYDLGAEVKLTYPHEKYKVESEQIYLYGVCEYCR